MNDTNQYQAPQSNVETSDVQRYCDISFTSATGRLGRVRYIAYTNGFKMLLFAIWGVLAFIDSTLLDNSGILAVGGGIILVITGLYLILIFTIQRSHDFDTSGWLSLLIIADAFIPILFLIFWIIPGTQGPNKYGVTSPPHTTVHILLALIIPIVAIIGILAAIAIPAYNGYIEQAQQLQP